ncbi:DUF4407 domain-containing protein [Mycobacterium sp. 1245805.9]|uniref:DUF4407 domain-containing protein n=1 Tax=Mycobacterium sp. 1245805.9 TaxID=1856862 RepID=UPI0007FF4548|nr:DUF4407 domain-containing protein [Mycobacterium sp. 1245805.9]OBI83503.1 hypothetical protein A9X00_05195 [Mycobacterium sp. 1245805.9]
MCAQEATESRSFRSRIEGPLTWLGGGHWREAGERHERATQADEALAGAVVLLGAALAWLVAGLAVQESTRWPTLAVVALTLVFGVLVGAVIRGTAGGPGRRWPGVVARGAVAIAVGVVVGELASLVVFASSIDHRLDERALRNADSAPAVAQASATLQQTKDTRGGLDRAVAQARERQDQALVVARCEYNPTPPCPQTRITGVPGAGPETRTANELLADAQHELDDALATRDRQAPELDARIAREEQALARARQDVAADAGRGLGARWVAMNDVTRAGAGPLALRLAAITFFALLCLLPLILRLWRGETTQDRHATARAERERAELEAETAIAIKRAQVRREAEIMWAEHQLTQARLAIEAQTEIDREQQRRRVMDALEAPVHAPSRRTFEPVQDDIYLPIAAEAEAASRAITPLPAAPEPEVELAPEAPANLPAPVEPGGEVEPHEERATPLIPSLPDATKAAARWIRPLVPPFVARVIDNTTQPLRTARHVFEEVEEITFALRRTRKVTLDSESTDAGEQAPRRSTADEAPAATARIPSSRGDRGRGTRHGVGAHPRRPGRPIAAKDVEGRTLAGREREAELTQREGPGELRAPEGPRQLPPGK